MSIALIFLAVSVALFLGFFAFMVIEAQTGIGIFSGARRSLDKQVMRSTFIAQHVNWSEFIAHIVQSIGARIAHDVAHISLLVVRFVERRLTAIVRYLRDRRPNVLAPKPSREPMLSQAVNYFKELLPKRRSRRQRGSRKGEE